MRQKQHAVSSRDEQTKEISVHQISSLLEGKTVALAHDCKETGAVDHLGLPLFCLSLASKGQLVASITSLFIIVPALK